MDARFFRVVLVAALFFSLGAGYRTPNFVIDAPTAELAQEIGQHAEKYRRELAQVWLGREMPNWAQPCMLSAQVGPQLGAGGATSFVFDRGEVFGWRMQIQGSRERLLDSVLPHEVTHTVFATHFRQALPRWADEGACTTVEHAEERFKQQQMLITFLKTGRGIAFSQMFAMKDYPRDVMPLYSQGYSLARYLIAQGGRRKFVAFLEQGLSDEHWVRAVHDHYGHGDLLALQNTWLAWVKSGSPLNERRGDGGLLATTVSAAQPARPAGQPIYRAQSADPSSSDRSISTNSESADDLVPVGKATRAVPPWRPAGTKSYGAAMSSPAADLATAEVAQAARPQPPQEPQQIVIERDRNSGGSTTATSTSGSVYPTREPIRDAAVETPIIRR